MSAAQVEDKGQKDSTPLMEAASAGHLDIVKLLLSHNADVNAHCATGNTPLMFACAGGQVDVVKVLLKHGANVEEQNENGHTPLMEAASAGHVEVAKVNTIFISTDFMNIAYDYNPRFDCCCCLMLCESSY